MKRVTLLLAAIGLLAFSSCKKDECHECHYDDANGDEVELGQYCNDELEDLEKNGYDDNGTNREVHCHEH